MFLSADASRWITVVIVFTVGFDGQTRVWSGLLGHSTWNVFKKGQGFGKVASKDKGRVLDRPIECRSRILSYSTVFCASSASFGSSGTQAGIHEHDEIQRYCKFEPLVP